MRAGTHQVEPRPVEPADAAEFGRQWAARVLRPGPLTETDRAAVEQAIRRCYRAARLRPPLLRWFASPDAAAPLRGSAAVRAAALLEAFPARRHRLRLQGLLQPSVWASGQLIMSELEFSGLSHGRGHKISLIFVATSYGPAARQPDLNSARPASTPFGAMNERRTRYARLQLVEILLGLVNRGMIRAQHPDAVGQHRLELGDRGRGVPRLTAPKGDVVADGQRVRVVWTESPAVVVEHGGGQHHGLGVVTGPTTPLGDHAARFQRVWMIDPKDPHPLGEQRLRGRPRRGQITRLALPVRDVAQERQGLRVVRAEDPVGVGVQGREQLQRTDEVAGRTPTTGELVAAVKDCGWSTPSTRTFSARADSHAAIAPASSPDSLGAYRPNRRTWISSAISSAADPGQAFRLGSSQVPAGTFTGANESVDVVCPAPLP